MQAHDDKPLIARQGVMPQAAHDIPDDEERDDPMEPRATAV
jgi:hypothetical protein